MIKMMIKATYLFNMWLKTYRRKPRTIDAVQFDGTAQGAEDLVNEYFNLTRDYEYLYFDGNYDAEAVCKGDWLVIENRHVVEVIDRDIFSDMYEEYES